jgi:hypothetical protein
MAETRSVAPPETGLPGRGDRGGVSGPGGNTVGFAGSPAQGVLRVAAATEDGETVSIGADVYEMDTHDAETITTGRIRVDVSGGSTVKAQGTLTIAEPVTADDTFTIDTTVYTLKAGATAAAGEVGMGADEAATKLAIVAAINGTDGFNSAHPTVSAAAFAGDDCVLTALAGGTAGDAIATTETFTHVSNVFDAGTLGTTTAGVDPTAGESSDAIIAAINGGLAVAAESILAIDIGANEVLVLTADRPGGTPVPSTKTTALAETLGGTDNAWDTAALRAGQAVAGRRFVVDTRVPNAAEVALGNMHIACPGFTPSGAIVIVVTTATGIAVAWVGATLFAANRCTLDNSGVVDWATTDTVFVMAWE